MIMDATEIEISYRTAKNKRMQVGVLADLNGVTRRQMERYLEKSGLDPPKPKSRELGKKKSWRVQDAMDLYCEGKTDAQIAERLGVAKTSIWKWRTGAGLLPNRGKKVETDDTDRG